MDLEYIGAILKQHRINRNMSIRELSNISNVASSTIRNRKKFSKSAHIKGNM